MKTVIAFFAVIAVAIGCAANAPEPAARTHECSPQVCAIGWHWSPTACRCLPG